MDKKYNHEAQFEWRKEIPGLRVTMNEQNLDLLDALDAPHRKDVLVAIRQSLEEGENHLRPDAMKEEISMAISSVGKFIIIHAGKNPDPKEKQHQAELMQAICTLTLTAHNHGFLTINDMYELSRKAVNRVETLDEDDLLHEVAMYFLGQVERAEAIKLSKNDAAASQSEPSPPEA